MTYKFIYLLSNKKPTNWWGRQNAAPLNNLGRLQVKFTAPLPVTLRQTVTELCASRPAATVLRIFVQYLVAFCSRPEGASDVISSRFVRLAVPNKPVKCCDPCLNRSPKIRPEAVGGCSFESFSNFAINADQK